jgi:hypothetical protein
MINKDAEPLKVLEGVTNTLELYPDRITVRRKDAIGKLLPSLFGGDVTIFLRDITDVRVYSSRLLARSWIQVVVIAKNGESIGFACKSNQYQCAHAIKDMIEDLRSREQVAPHFKTLEQTSS